ncbi:MAG: tetratricopeptide repeat protein, partial [Bryobacterales bacterium]|nr:tetratricopeptide repeat protein [Bryobacterales bacterium]
MKHLIAILFWAIFATAAGPVDAHRHLQEAQALLDQASIHGGVKLIAQAEKAIEAAEQASSGTLHAFRLRAELLLRQRHFTDALRFARKFNAAAPDELQGYALVVRACLALGCYAEAEKAAQWMLNLRPGDPESLAHGAMMREHWGDLEGAIEFFAQALQKLPPQQTSRRAELACQIGRIALDQQRAADAEALADQAAAIEPLHVEVMRLRADVAASKGEWARSVEILLDGEQLMEPDVLMRLAEGSRKIGDAKAARAYLEQFDNLTAGHPGWAPERVLWLVDAGRHEEALKLSQTAVEGRKDVRMLDAHALALHANSRHEEAKQVLQ